ncbi:DUF692 domain-containing protein [Streptomyces albipurpureus]|uniref:DUF692 family protein n=1 Tax=Streptomyces albipurpureus TaxID=2897419 RepID=A0ABT0UES1_9ACTN|nr:DUF692 domain-containing protein [Streptomyces sp. CWNU-1]MCM2387067.1 DUF692 family protein [Streptomyces sp. CWNU-1]
MELGIGIGWRPEIAETVEGLPELGWVEVVAENVCLGHLPESLSRLRSRGVTVVPHGVSLGLGGADRPSEQKLKDLAERAMALGSPLVTEHIAFVRAGGALTASPQLEAGHLLPVPRTWDALKVLCENVRIAQDSLPVPLALENIAALISWPGEELTEGQFLAELVERTGVGLLIDVANLHTNHVNQGEDPAKALDELPVEAIRYVHVAGGVERDGVWHDSHAHPVTEPVLDVLRELCSRVSPPGVLLERDDDFPASDESHSALAGELDAIRQVVRGDGGPAPSVASPEPGGRSARSAAQPALDQSARERIGIAQAALLSSLVAGGPAPEGFDHQRLRVQRRALAAKRASVIARIAPELPEILGDDYRPAFLAYARGRPMGSGYRRDALSFVEHLLIAGRPTDERSRRQLTRWWEDRVATRPPRRATRLARAARDRLIRR